MNKAKALLAAGIIGLSPIVHANNTETAPENTTNKNLIEALDISNNENISNSTISLEVAQKIIQENRIKEFIDKIESHGAESYEVDGTRYELSGARRCLYYYGKEVFEEKLSNVIDSIEANPDKYGGFDEAGNLHLNEEAMKSLTENSFHEFLQKSEIQGKVISSAALLSLIGSFSLMLYIVRNTHR